MVAFLSAVSAHADDTNAFSPIISYQYLDALDAPGAETTILSPIVSYQYYEWPGDENVVLQSSAKVSYFYNTGGTGPSVGLRGCVCDASGAPVAGATVSASVLNLMMASVQTAADGRYQLPPLPPGVYVLGAGKPSFVSDKRVLSLSEQFFQQDFQLRTFPALPDFQVANSTVPFLLSSLDELHGAKLMVFDGAQFVDNLNLIDPNKMTVVLTHGWIPCLTSGGIHYWPSNMARALRAKGLSSAQANIVGWSWETDATSCDIHEQLTPRHGLALGKALYHELGSTYHQPLDFMGHSLGTQVNRYAVDYLHGQASAKQEAAAPPWSSNRTHVTIFDDPGISRLFNFHNSLLSQLRILLDEGAEGLGWKTPIPISSAWIDNYIADVGYPHSSAVNIDLQKGDGLIDSHSYPQHWYSNSVRSATSDSVLGFRQSFAYYRMTGGSESDFRSATANFAKGSTYHQKPSSNNDLDLELLPWTDFFDPYVPAAGELLDRGADNVVGRVETAIRTGQVALEVVEYAAVGVYRGVNWVWNAAGNGLNNVANAVRDLQNQPSISAALRTSPPLFLGNLKANNAGPVSSNTPAYLWLSVAVPAEAVGMVFDFTITGDGRDDSFAFGINGTNLFSLETKFVADGELSTSRLMDVSSYAGLTNEFFFGIMGGTSTNCTVTVTGIRFFTLALPALAITQTNGATLLSWPSSANGFVLESSLSLGILAWATVTNTPTLFAGRFSVANVRTNETRFFRLRR